VVALGEAADDPEVDPLEGEPLAAPLGVEALGLLRGERDRVGLVGGLLEVDDAADGSWARWLTR
jgi:hypothetical protein